MKTSYKPMKAGGHPTDFYNYFLVRPRGIDVNRTGKPWIPTVVQEFDGELYASGNELKPLQWSRDNTDMSKGCSSKIAEVDLEWCELPC